MHLLTCPGIRFASRPVNALRDLFGRRPPPGRVWCWPRRPDLLKDNLRDNLQDNLPADVCDRGLFEADADHALERAEDLILTAAREASGAHDRLLVRVFDDMRRYPDRQIVLEDMVQRLEPWLGARDYQPGPALPRGASRRLGALLVRPGSLVRTARACGSALRSGSRGSRRPRSPLGGRRLDDRGCVLPHHLLTPNARLSLEALHRRWVCSSIDSW